MPSGIYPRTNEHKTILKNNLHKNIVFWTQENEKYLIDNIRYKSASEIGKDIGKNKSTVILKIRQLNLKWDYPEKRIRLEQKRILAVQESLKRPEIINKRKLNGLKREKNPAWKGDNVGYRGIHRWVTKNKPKPKECEICGNEKDKNGKIKLELANISGEYKRDINDFEWAHCSCHRNKDFPDGNMGKNFVKSNLESSIYKKYSRGNLHIKNEQIK